MTTPSRPPCPGSSAPSPRGTRSRACPGAPHGRPRRRRLPHQSHSPPQAQPPAGLHHRRRRRHCPSSDRHSVTGPRRSSLPMRSSRLLVCSLPRSYGGLRRGRRRRPRAPRFRRRSSFGLRDCAEDGSPFVELSMRMTLPPAHLVGGVCWSAPWCRRC